MTKTRLRESADNMSNEADIIDYSDIPETDFSASVRGKYYERAKQGTNVVLLEPDVAAVFNDSAAVNQALREYLGEHVRKTVASPAPPTGKPQTLPPTPPPTPRAK